MLDIHPSWSGLPAEIETTNGWRWFHIGRWLDKDQYLALLSRCEQEQPIELEEIKDALGLCVEALTRIRGARKRSRLQQIRWARRTGLALFAALHARPAFDISNNDDERMTAFLPFFDRETRIVVSLHLPKPIGGADRAPIESNLRTTLEAEAAKLRTLVRLCCEHVVATREGAEVGAFA